MCIKLNWILKDGFWHLNEPHEWDCEKEIGLLYNAHGLMAHREAGNGG